MENDSDFQPPGFLNSLRSREFARELKRNLGLGFGASLALVTCVGLLPDLRAYHW